MDQGAVCPALARADSRRVCRHPGQANQTRVTNEARGISVTADWDWNDNLASKVIASSRTSEYKAGLDDDSVERDFLSFPETGDADQTSGWSWPRRGRSPCSSPATADRRPDSGSRVATPGGGRRV